MKEQIEIVNVIKSFKGMVPESFYDKKNSVSGFIFQLKEDDEILQFFEVLDSLIISPETLRKITEYFFKSQDDFRYFFRSTIK